MCLLSESHVISRDALLVRPLSHGGICSSSQISNILSNNRPCVLPSTKVRLIHNHIALHLHLPHSHAATSTLVARVTIISVSASRDLFVFTQVGSTTTRLGHLDLLQTSACCEEKIIESKFKVSSEGIYPSKSFLLSLRIVPFLPSSLSFP